LETANVLATLCSSKLEEHLLAAAANWSGGTFTGDFAAEGYPQLRFEATRSDATDDGGVPNSLLSITVVTWEDRVSNGTWDAGEPRTSFASKLARNVAYQHEANGT
jgi:hypothetical protein